MQRYCTPLPHCRSSANAPMKYYSVLFLSTLFLRLRHLIRHLSFATDDGRLDSVRLTNRHPSHLGICIGLVSVGTQTQIQNRLIRSIAGVGQFRVIAILMLFCSPRFRRAWGWLSPEIVLCRCFPATKEHSNGRGGALLQP